MTLLQQRYCLTHKSIAADKATGHELKYQVKIHISFLSSTCQNALFDTISGGFFRDGILNEHQSEDLKSDVVALGHLTKRRLFQINHSHNSCSNWRPLMKSKVF